MAYMTEAQCAEGSNTGLKAGTYKLIPLRYESFVSKNGKTIPKHICAFADSEDTIEIVGFKFHDEIKKLNESIVPEVTVLEVQVLDNGTQYPDYEVKIIAGSKPPEAVPFN